MKQIILFALLCVCYIVPGFSQKVTVLDKTTSQPLPYILVKSNSSNLTLQTNNKGVVDISSLKQSDSISFSFVGYKTMVLSYGQIESAKFKIRMSDKTYSIGELVVSASRFEEKKEDVPQQIQVMKSKELQFMNQQTMADVIQQSGNVLVQKSQQAGGSPIIRGFETNKVLMVVDGVRMNNAIYRGGHIQNVITLDNTIMDRVEIVFGAGSVVYGSDALGGVMHFYTKNPMLADSGSKALIKANAFTRYSTSCEEKSAHVDFNIGLNKVAFLTSITYSDYGDLRQGNNSNPFYGERRPGTVGFPMPMTVVRIVDEAGADVPDGTSGELWVRGTNVCDGYWRRPDATAAAFADGWFRTGDVGVRAADGYITLEGRRSDLIISGGFNIYPREIEELLAEQEGVHEAAVVGVKDAVRGEVPVAYLVCDASGNVEALAQQVRTQLASFKVPRGFVRVEALPRTALGKVQRHLLPPWTPA